MYNIIVLIPLFYLLTYVNYYFKLCLWLCLLFVSIVKNLEKINKELVKYQFERVAANRFQDISTRRNIEKENELIQLLALAGLFITPLLEIICFYFFPNLATTCGIYQVFLYKK